MTTTEQYLMSLQGASLLLYDHYPVPRTVVHDDVFWMNPRRQAFHFHIGFRVILWGVSFSRCSSGWIAIVEPVAASLSLQCLMFGTWNSSIAPKRCVSLNGVILSPCLMNYSRKSRAEIDGFERETSATIDAVNFHIAKLISHGTYRLHRMLLLFFDIEDET